MKGKLFKSNKNKIIFGVLGGIGELFDIDPTLIRLGFIFLTIFTACFPGTLFYIIAALIIPRETSNNAKQDASTFN